MRVILLAQGSARRWDGYLGRRKQQVVIGGETLLERAVRLFADRGCEVVIVGPAEFEHPKARLVTLDDPWVIPNDMAKFVGSRQLWADDERTVIGWADCWYSEHAADLIVNHPSDELHYFRRPGPSDLTGHRWDESFAVSFGPSEYDRVLELAWQVHRDWEAGRMKRRDGGHIPVRNHQALALGLPYDRRSLLVNAPNQTAIDDWTDDLDSPADYARWVGRHEVGALRVAVCVPWFGGDEHRKRAWKFVRANYERLGVPLYVGADDSGGQWTNRARGVNNAVRQALADDPDVLVIGDADVVVTSEGLWAGAHAAHMTGEFVTCYRDYHRLTMSQTRDVEHGIVPIETQAAVKPWWKHMSAAVAVTPDLFDRVGGFDERFQSWGGEDRAFWMACDAIARGRVSVPDVHRIHQPAWHLWHPQSPERDPSHPNKKVVQELGHRYKRATGWLTSGGMLGALGDEDAPLNLEALLALMSEPGGPLAKEPVNVASQP